MTWYTSGELPVVTGSASADMHAKLRDRRNRGNGRLPRSLAQPLAWLRARGLGRLQVSVGKARDGVTGHARQAVPELRVHRRRACLGRGHRRGARGRLPLPSCQLQRPAGRDLLNEIARERHQGIVRAHEPSPFPLPPWPIADPPDADVPVAVVCEPTGTLMCTTGCWADPPLPAWTGFCACC